MPRVSELTAQLKACLERIVPGNGFETELRAVLTGPAQGRTDQAMPFAMLRTVLDTRVSGAGCQASRKRTYQVEVAFKASAEDALLDAAAVDIQRALGFGRDDFDDRFPGLIDDEDQIDFAEGSTNGKPTRVVIVTFSLIYVETYH